MGKQHDSANSAVGTTSGDEGSCAGALAIWLQHCGTCCTHAELPCRAPGAADCRLRPGQAFLLHCKPVWFCVSSNGTQRSTWQWQGSCREGRPGTCGKLQSRRASKCMTAAEFGRRGPTWTPGYSRPQQSRLVPTPSSSGKPKRQRLGGRGPPAAEACNHEGPRLGPGHDAPEDPLGHHAHWGVMHHCKGHGHLAVHGQQQGFSRLDAALCPDPYTPPGLQACMIGPFRPCLK